MQQKENTSMSGASSMAPGRTACGGKGPGGFVLSVLPFFLFFLSGACSLIYEVVWSRMLVVVMGNTAFATTTILASFMAGLALGSYWWGRFIEAHPEKPFAVFGILEIGVGVLALLFPLLLKTISPCERWASDLAGTGYSLHLLLRFVLCLAVLAAPTFLMGGTFAVLGKHVIQDGAACGRSSALLYAVNTFGAVAGAFLAGFFLVHHLGTGGSIRLAACISIAAGAAAVLAGRAAPSSGSKSREETGAKTRRQPASSPQPLAGLVLAATAASGFCSLACQVVWTRLLMLVGDNSIYAFTVILMAFLTGIALGSLLVAPAMRHIKNKAAVFAFMLAGTGAAVYCFPFFVQFKTAAADMPYWAFLFFKLPAAGLLAAAILMGALFPLGVSVYTAYHREVGRSLGTVFAANTAGAVCGAAAAGFFLIPVLGLHKTALLLSGLYVAMGALLLIVRLRFLQAAGVALTAAGVIAAGGWYMPGDFFPRLYGQLEPDSELIYYRESAATTATVFQRPDGTRSLYLNGIAELDTTPLSVQTFKLMGALPAVVHPKPSRALMVTFGAGVTAGTAACFADSIDCVDLAQQAGDIARLFHQTNGRISESSMCSLFVDDARHFLRTTGNRYDIIVSDATHPRSYDSWVLFTQDFYRLVHSRLSSGGVFCQWIPFHGMNVQQYLSIIRTFSSVFPHTSIWYVGEAYSLMLATSTALAIDFQDLWKRLKRPEIRENLEQVALDNPFVLLSAFAMGEKQVQAMAGEGGDILTDDSPAHLFFPPRASLKEQYDVWPRQNFEKLKSYEESILPFLHHIAGQDSQREKIKAAIKRYEAMKNSHKGQKPFERY